VNYDGPCCLAYIFFAQCPLLLTSLATIHSYRHNLNRGPYSTFPDCYRVRKIARDSTISLRRLMTRLMTSNNVSSLWETIFRLVLRGIRRTLFPHYNFASPERFLLLIEYVLSLPRLEDNFPICLYNHVVWREFLDYLHSLAVAARVALSFSFFNF